MENIDSKFDGRRCLVYTNDFPEPLRGVLTISRPAGTMISLVDEKGQRMISRASIKRIELEEPDDT